MSSNIVNQLVDALLKVDDDEASYVSHILSALVNITLADAHGPVILATEPVVAKLREIACRMELAAASKAAIILSYITHSSNEIQ